ncbi:uncharacterized protein LOC144142287 isoform X5 [Haemaphysalis longicornis]
MAYEQQQRGHGYVVAISIPTGTLRAKIYDGSTADIVKCAKCGFVPEKFYKLDCQHILCTYCARFTGSYTCVTDNTTTEIAMPMLAPVLENIPLKFSLVDCPACGQTFQYRGIKKHVQKKHPNLWEEGNQHASYDDKAHEETNTGDRVLPATPTNPSSVTEAPGTSMSGTDPMPMNLHTKATFKEERHKATTHRLEAEAVLKKQGSQREVAVLLVNHLEEANSILLKLDSGDADGDSFKKPVRGTPNLKFGFPRVISLQQIENPKEGFLIQDSIVFKFTIQ